MLVLSAMKMETSVSGRDPVNGWYALRSLRHMYTVHLRLLFGTNGSVVCARRQDTAASHLAGQVSLSSPVFSDGAAESRFVARREFVP